MNAGRKIRTRKPRCYMIYAMAPEGIKPAEANRMINEMVDDDALPLALWHDHFIGDKGGTIIYYVQNQSELDALFDNDHLDGWRVDYRPLIFSFSPGAFDAQTAYTLKAYGNEDWDALRNQKRPDYEGRNLSEEANSAEEV